MNKLLRKAVVPAKNLIAYHGLLSKKTSELELIAMPVEHEQHTISAQRLHASVYLARGFIRGDEIDKDGRLTLAADPHQVHAEYFIVTDKKNTQIVRATARQIRAENGKGFDSFPILSLSRIYSGKKSEIIRYPPARCVEISGLAKLKGESAAAPLMLYREMLKYSLIKGDKIWLMACDVRLYPRLKLLFGRAITQIGERTPYYGGDVIPAMMRIEEIIPALVTAIKHSTIPYRSIRKSVARFILSAYQEDEITPAELKELKKLKVWTSADG